MNEPGPTSDFACKHCGEMGICTHCQLCRRCRIESGEDTCHICRLTIGSEAIRGRQSLSPRIRADFEYATNLSAPIPILILSVDGRSFDPKHMGLINGLTEAERVFIRGVEEAYLKAFILAGEESKNESADNGS